MLVSQGDTSVGVVLGKNFAKVHEAPTTPGSVGDGADVVIGSNRGLWLFERLHGSIYKARQVYAPQIRPKTVHDLLRIAFIFAQIELWLQRDDQRGD